jgi:hypothetical protein
MEFFFFFVDIYYVEGIEYRLGFELMMPTLILY